MVFELLRPGVYKRETPGRPSILPGTQNVAGFVGISERGPMTPTSIDSISKYVSLFGGQFSGSFLSDAVKGFFDEGGRNCVIQRVVGTGNATASATLSNMNLGSPQNSIIVSAANPGAWGNGIRVSTTKFATTLAAQISVGAFTSITLQSIRGLEIGDLLHIDDASNPIVVKVFSINTSTKVVTIISATAGGTIPIGTEVKTSSMHVASSSLSANLAASATTTIPVTNSFSFRKDQIIWVTDGTTEIEGLVDRVEGNNIILQSSVTPSSLISAATSIVVSQEFYLTFTNKGTNPELPYRNLSMEPGNENYVDDLLSGTNNKSIYISVAEQTPSGTLLDRIPLPVLSQVLSGGANGSAPNDNEWIGSNAVTPKTGIRGFDDNKTINFLAVPGITTTAVQKDLVSYAENRGNVFVLLDAPKATVDPDALLSHRQNTLNIDSSFAAFYAPWVVVNDPDSINNTTKEVPPSALMAGLCARIGATRGIQKSPSNEILRSAIGLSKVYSDGEADLLHPNSINLIRSEPGTGIRITGGRTMTSRKDGKHFLSVRRVLNFIGVEVSTVLKQFLDEPNTADVRLTVENTVKSFLERMYRQGMVVDPLGGDNKDSAFFVVCNEDNNSIADINSGILRIDVGVYPPRAVEYIVFNLSLQDGNTSVQEQNNAA